MRLLRSAAAYFLGAGTALSGNPAARLPLRVNFTWTFAGNVVYAACQWGMLVVITKLGTPEMVGRFALGLAVTAPVIRFANLGLRVVQATDARGAYTFGEYLTLRLITTALALVAIAGIAVATGYRSEVALIVLIIGLSKAFEAVSDIFFGLLQQRERMDRTGRSLILKGLFSLLALGGTLYLTGSLAWAVLAMAVVMGLRLLTYDVPSGLMVLGPEQGLADVWRKWRPVVSQVLVRRAGSRRRMVRLWALALIALPLGFTAMLDSVNANLPRYIVEWQLGEHGLGIYAALSYMIVAGATVVEALGQAASSRLARHYANGEGRSFTRLLSSLVLVGALVGLGAVLVSLAAGEPILRLLYSREYAAHADVFVWVMAAAAIGYVASFMGYGITAAHYYRIKPANLALSVAASGLLCLLLVPRYGLVGAALALVASNCVQAMAGTACVLHALYRLRTVRKTT